MIHWMSYPMPALIPRSEAACWFHFWQASCDPDDSSELPGPLCSWNLREMTQMQKRESWHFACQEEGDWEDGPASKVVASEREDMSSPRRTRTIEWAMVCDPPTSDGDRLE